LGGAAGAVHVGLDSLLCFVLCNAHGDCGGVWSMLQNCSFHLSAKEGEERTEQPKLL